MAALRGRPADDVVSIACDVAGSLVPDGKRATLAVLEVADTVVGGLGRDAHQPLVRRAQDGRLLFYSGALVLAGLLRLDGNAILMDGHFRALRDQVFHECRHLEIVHGIFKTLSTAEREAFLIRTSFGAWELVGLAPTPRVAASIIAQVSGGSLALRQSQPKQWRDAIAVLASFGDFVVPLLQDAAARGGPNRDVFEQALSRHRRSR